MVTRCGDDADGGVEEERIPYLEGYNPATRKQKTAMDLTNMFQAIVAVATDPVKCKRKFSH